MLYFYFEKGSLFGDDGGIRGGCLVFFPENGGFFIYFFRAKGEKDF